MTHSSRFSASEVLAIHLWKRTTSPHPDKSGQKWDVIDSTPGGHEMCDMYRAEAKRVIAAMEEAILPTEEECGYLTCKCEAGCVRINAGVA